MSAGQLDIDIEKGSRFEMTVEITDDAGELQDFSGYVGYAQVRATAATGSTLWAEMDVSAVTTGTFLLSIASSATSLMPDPLALPARPFRPGHWDLLIAPTSSASATHAEKWLNGTAFVYPTGTVPG
jgi:hypothetical protein